MTEIVPNSYSVDGLGITRLFHINEDGVTRVEVPFTQSVYDELLQTLADEEAARVADMTESPPPAPPQVFPLPTTP